MAVASGFASTPKIVRARGRMIRIDITAAAFEAIVATMPLGSAGYEAECTASGEVRIWLAADVVNKLRALRLDAPSQHYHHYHHSPDPLRRKHSGSN
jgi:hypothetical protein